MEFFKYVLPSHALLQVLAYLPDSVTSVLQICCSDPLRRAGIKLDVDGNQVPDEGNQALPTACHLKRMWYLRGIQLSRADQNSCYFEIPDYPPRVRLGEVSTTKKTLCT